MKDRRRENSNAKSVTPNTKLRVGIFGGSGYGGAELLRLLLLHPHVDVSLVTANEHAGKTVGEVHRNLYGLTDLHFARAPENYAELKDFDVIFLALPHGQAMELAPRIIHAAPNVKLIDLSGDFRLRNAAQFEEFYGRAQTEMDLQKEFIYGLPETNRNSITRAKYISNPGCFATATLLALAPLVANNLLKGRVVVDAKTGSSGSGAKPAANTHHPQRMNSFYAYKPFTHQHVPEIEQELARVGDWSSELIFMTHSLPVARGIFASVYGEMKQPLKTDEVRAIYEEFYHHSFFVRLIEGSPDINWVKTTNFCDIGMASRANHLAVFSAIDNLVKGAAGGAVHNMNLMFGFDEKAGLILTGSNP